MLKNIWTSFNMCLSMFTILPSFPYEWDDNNRDTMLLCFPFVGLIIGFLWFAFYTLLSLIKINNFVYIKVLLIELFPFIISGFIHVDGYMDVVDAILSRRDKLTKIKILKDSHVGSFAVIYIIILFLFNYMSLFSVVSNHHFLYFTILFYIPMFSRLMSSFSLFIFNKIEQSEYKIEFDKSIFKLFIPVLIIFLLTSAFINLKFIIVLIVEIIVHFLCVIWCNKNFGGINGDVSGFGICVSEAVALFSLSIVFNI